MNKKTIRTAALSASLLLLSQGISLAQSGWSDSAIQVRVGAFFPEGDSDFWRDNESVFTLDVSDFESASIGFSFVTSISNHFEVGLNADLYEEEVLSAYRGFVDEAGFPIFHDTRLQTAPVTVDVRLLPTGRFRNRGGRRVQKPVLYVGAGVGVNFWEYEEVGDLLDFAFDPPEIFFGRFIDRGTAFETHVLAGVELPLGSAASLIFEGRHTWSDDKLNGDFAGLGQIDLGGTSVFVGGSFRF